jgi:tRNA (mo5U34)-methyltransferase
VKVATVTTRRAAVEPGSLRKIGLPPDNTARALLHPRRQRRKETPVGSAPNVGYVRFALITHDDETGKPGLETHRRGGSMQDLGTRGVEALRREADALGWFHRIDLGHGIVTNALYDPRRTLREIKLPPSLDGKTVLDVGAWDGFYSFEMERRGAGRVLATDSFSWSGPGWGTKASFELARRALGSNVEDLDIDVMDLSAERVGRFDIVLCLGVLYHLRHPLLALERLFDVTGEILVLETEVDLLWQRRPAAAFYPGNELCGDESNWWGPNPKAVVGMLQASGFRRVEIANRHSLPRIVARATRHRIKREGGNPFFRTLRTDRMVFHTWP